MGDPVSIVNIGELAKPATVLIEKIADAVGGAFRPMQITRIARAEAEAAIIRAEGEIQVTELQHRAIQRFFAEEGKKQENMEQITANAVLQLETDANPQAMEDDWITNFFDKCRIVSDREMQVLWSKILSGEANAPGTFSRRTVNFLGSLDKDDAVIFSKCCSLCWSIGGDTVPLVYNHNNAIYGRAGMGFNALIHLQDIGLVTFEHDSNHPFVETELRQREVVEYRGDQYFIDFRAENGNELRIGQLLLTQVGKELAKVCDPPGLPDFVEYVIKTWTGAGHRLSCPYPRQLRACPGLNPAPCP